MRPSAEEDPAAGEDTAPVKLPSLAENRQARDTHSDRTQGKEGGAQWYGVARATAAEEQDTRRVKEDQQSTDVGAQDRQLESSSGTRLMGSIGHDRQAEEAQGGLSGRSSFHSTELLCSPSAVQHQVDTRSSPPHQAAAASAAAAVAPLTREQSYEDAQHSFSRGEESAEPTSPPCASQRHTPADQTWQGSPTGGATGQGAARPGDVAADSPLGAAAAPLVLCAPAEQPEPPAAATRREQAAPTTPQKAVPSAPDALTQLCMYDATPPPAACAGSDAGSQAAVVACEGQLEPGTVAGALAQQSPAQGTASQGGRGQVAEGGHAAGVVEEASSAGAAEAQDQRSSKLGKGQAEDQQQPAGVAEVEQPVVAAEVEQPPGAAEVGQPASAVEVEQLLGAAEVGQQEQPVTAAEAGQQQPAATTEVAGVEGKQAMVEAEQQPAAPLAKPEEKQAMTDEGQQLEAAEMGEQLPAVAVEAEEQQPPATVAQAVRQQTGAVAQVEEQQPAAAAEAQVAEELPTAAAEAEEQQPAAPEAQAEEQQPAAPEAQAKEQQPAVAEAQAKEQQSAGAEAQAKEQQSAAAAEAEEQQPAAAAETEEQQPVAAAEAEEQQPAAAAEAEEQQPAAAAGAEEQQPAVDMEVDTPMATVAQQLEGVGEQPAAVEEAEQQGAAEALHPAGEHEPPKAGAQVPAPEQVQAQPPASMDSTAAAAGQAAPAAPLAAVPDVDMEEGEAQAPAQAAAGSQAVAAEQVVEPQMPAGQGATQGMAGGVARLVGKGNAAAAAAGAAPGGASLLETHGEPAAGQPGRGVVPAVPAGASAADKAAGKEGPAACQSSAGTPPAAPHAAAAATPAPPTPCTAPLPAGSPLVMPAAEDTHASAPEADLDRGNSMDAATAARLAHELGVALAMESYTGSFGSGTAPAAPGGGPQTCAWGGAAAGRSKPPLHTTPQGPSMASPWAGRTCKQAPAHAQQLGLLDMDMEDVGMAEEAGCTTQGGGGAVEQEDGAGMPPLEATPSPGPASPAVPAAGGLHAQMQVCVCVRLCGCCVLRVASAGSGLPAFIGAVGAGGHVSQPWACAPLHAHPCAHKPMLQQP